MTYIRNKLVEFVYIVTSLHCYDQAEIRSLKN